MAMVCFSVFNWTSRCFNATGLQSIAIMGRLFRTLSRPSPALSLLTSRSGTALTKPPLRRCLAGGATPPPPPPSTPPSQQKQASSNIVAIQDDADYDKRVRATKQPVLLQFHATWCAPCKLLRPRLEKAVRGRPGLLLATVDVDELPDLAAEFRVSSVPMVLAVREGHVLGSFVGLKESEAVQDFVDSFAEKQGV